MYYEIAYESRKWTQTVSDTSETFVYRICDEDLAESDVTYGAFHTPNDDVGLAKFIYSTFPDTRVFTTPGGDIILYLTQIDAAERDDDSWEVTLTYGTPESNAPQLVGTYVQFGFSTNGDTKKISRSISTRNSAARTDITTGVPANYNLIGYTSTGVDGADISDAGLAFSITGYYSADIWDTSVITMLTALTKRYNNALFYGFPAGEVLLDNVEASGEVVKTTPVTFHFLHSPNQNAVSDSPFPALTALGHDLIDYRYLPEVSNSVLLQLPAFRYVHQVREAGNFNLLGI